MLQQTTVTTVQKYYRPFLRQFPTVFDLAAAPIHDVLMFWAGLGYYRRAHHLHRCAQHIVNHYNGVWPRCERKLLSLPGVGDYIAGAIRAIAFQEEAAAVDTNVRRVLGRLLGVPDIDVKMVKRVLSQMRWDGVRVGDFYQGVMDIGRTLCGVKSWYCLECPLQHQCVTQVQGAGESLNPQNKRSKKDKPVKKACFFVHKSDDQYYLCLGSPEGRMLEGLWIFPSTQWMAPQDFEQVRQTWSQDMVSQTEEHVVKHVFSHFTLLAHLVVVEHAPAYNVGGKWVDSKDFGLYPMSALAHRLVRIALSFD